AASLVATSPALFPYTTLFRSKSIEAKIIWGERAEVAGPNGHFQRVPKGIVSFIQTNKFDLGGTFDYDKLVEHAEEIFRYGDSEKDRKSTRLNSSHVKISYAVF